MVLIIGVHNGYYATSAPIEKLRTRSSAKGGEKVVKGE